MPSLHPHPSGDADSTQQPVCLRRPSVEWEQSYTRFLEQFRRSGEDGHLGDSLHRCGSFAAFVDWLERSQTHMDSPTYQAMLVFWLTYGDTIVAESQITYRRDGVITIGYIVAPSHRRNGYGHCLLHHTLNAARMLGIRSLRLSCRETNTASIRIIERQGGRRIRRSGSALRHFQIDL